MQDKFKSAYLPINETFIDLLSTTTIHQRVRCHETTHGTGTGILNPMTAGFFFSISMQTCSLISNRMSEIVTHTSMRLSKVFLCTDMYTGNGYIYEFSIYIQVNWMKKIYLKKYQISIFQI